MSAMSLPNVRLFILFRVLFNARLYYPVFSILFLDFGISTEQFLLLNMIWGVSIVLLEVPSGALADAIGRRNLLVVGAICMVVEMLVLAFAPREPDLPWILFALLALNRVLSGAAEAAVSGADEALAVDSLKEKGLGDEWPTVLEKQMRWQSAAFFVAMLAGGLVYDENLLNSIGAFFGMDWGLTRAESMRFVIWPCVVTSIGVLVCALRMTEPAVDSGDGLGEASTLDNPSPEGGIGACKTALSASIVNIKQAGLWILASHFATVLIIGGFLLDSIARTFVTLSSQYYQVIEIPEALFGFLGAGMAVIGIFLPALAKYMTTSLKPGTNFAILVISALIGLVVAAMAIPYIGVVAIIFIYLPMPLVNYILSKEINALAPSSQRATIISFKSLSFNLAYACVSVVFAGLVRATEEQARADAPDLSDRALENVKFVDSLPLLTSLFLICVAIFALWANRKLKKSAAYAEKVEGLG